MLSGRPSVVAEQPRILGQAVQILDYAFASSATGFINCVREQVDDIDAGEDPPQKSVFQINLTACLIEELLRPSWQLALSIEAAAAIDYRRDLFPVRRLFDQSCDLTRAQGRMADE